MTAPAAGISLRELEQFIAGEAARIEAVQGDLIAKGFLETADGEQMAKVRKYDAVGRLIAFVRADAMMIERLRELASRTSSARSQVPPANPLARGQGK